jgi:hypothetical protein
MDLKTLCVVEEEETSENSGKGCQALNSLVHVVTVDSVQNVQVRIREILVLSDGVD